MLLDVQKTSEIIFRFLSQKAKLPKKLVIFDLGSLIIMQTTEANSHAVTTDLGSRESKYQLLTETRLKKTLFQPKPADKEKVTASTRRTGLKAKNIFKGTLMTSDQHGNH